MNSRVSWSVDGIDPSVRERAEAAARRAGMSLSDWLNSTIGESAPAQFPRRPTSSAPAMPSQESRDVADIHQRLDSITRQIEQISQPAQRRAATRRATTPRRESAQRADRRPAAERRHLAPRRAAVADFEPGAAAPGPDANPAEQRSARPTTVERAAAQVYRPSPPLSPVSFDSAIAEIAARQNELDGSAAADAAALRAADARLPADGAYAPPPCAACRTFGPGFLLARTSSAQDHEPDRGAAASRSRSSSRSPRSAANSPKSARHHRSDAAPRDRIDRERNPLAVAPHRRKPPERHRRPGAGRHRTRARRNPRSAALADAGRATHRL